LNICFALPDALYGGIHTFALNLGRQFAGDGHRVSAVISARGVNDDGLGDLVELKEVMDVRVCTQRRVLARSRFLHRVLDTIEASEPDVVILNHTLWGQAALPYLSASMRRIVVVHGLAEGEIELAGANPEYWDVLIAVGPGLYQQLAAKWGNERVQFIPVGVPEPSRTRVSDLREAELKICYVGRIAQGQKNVFLIPEIARRLGQLGVSFTWTVVGEGPDLGALVEKVGKTGLPTRFGFAGGCNQDGVQEILARQHVLVLPSNWESIGHVLLEAQMLGVVPVVSCLPGATDFVITRGHNGLLCRPGDAADFAGALASLSVDRGALERLSLAALKGVRERFEISRIAAHYYDLFGSISRTNSLPRRKSSILGYYPIPRSLLPSRVRTALRLGRDRVLDRVRKAEAGRARSAPSREPQGPAHPESLAEERDP
jgi:glycosyltransferase involved in cell wall biosynthesis